MQSVLLSQQAATSTEAQPSQASAMQSQVHGGDNGVQELPCCNPNRGISWFTWLAPASMKQVKYRCWICCKSLDGFVYQILAAGCACTAGKSQTCGHINSLCQIVTVLKRPIGHVGYTDVLSPTSMLCRWNQPGAGASVYCRTRPINKLAITKDAEMGVKGKGFKCNRGEEGVEESDYRPAEVIVSLFVLFVCLVVWWRYILTSVLCKQVTDKMRRLLAKCLGGAAVRGGFQHTAAEVSWGLMENAVYAEARRVASSAAWVGMGAGLNKAIKGKAKRRNDVDVSLESND